MIRLKHFSWSVMLASGITLAAGSTASAQLGGNLRNGLEQGGRTFGNAGAQMRNNISRGSSTIGSRSAEMLPHWG
jgi:hypothetical protein